MTPRRLVALVLGLAALLPAAPAGAAPPLRAERPSYKVGDKWIRSDGIYEIVRIEQGMYVFMSGPHREVLLSPDLAVARVRFGERVAEFHPPPKIAWPLEVGKSGSSRVRWRGFLMPPGMHAPGTVSWKVEAVEPVQVAGTTLQTFRVAWELKFTRSGLRGGGRRRAEGAEDDRTWRTWYAPEVKQWVKGDAEDLGFLRFTVVAFEREGAQPLAVALLTPRGGAHVAEPEVLLQGKASGADGVARVTLTVNGTDIALPQPTAPQPEILLHVPVRLQEGRNVVLVTATDPGGATRQEARVVFYDKAVAAAPPGAPGERKISPTLPGPSGLTPAPSVAVTPKPEAAAAPPPPLQVTLTSPRDQLHVEQETIALAGVASGGHGIARVTVTLNGVEVGRVAEEKLRPALPVNLPLKLAEGANTVVVTALDASGAVHQEVRTVLLEKHVPLTVSVRYPLEGTHVTEEGSVVAAVVASSRGVADVRVTLNGQEVGRVEERTPQKSLVVSVPITLRAGANAVALVARDAAGAVQQEIRTIVFDPPKVAALPPLPAAAPAPPQVHDQWAVVIGVGSYEAPSIPRLQYTVADAELVYQTLIGPAGFKKDHVLLLTDKSERKPTLRNVKWALGTFLGRSAQKDDTVVIYYAGHGAPEVDTRGIERDGLAKYLIPADADPDDLYSTALPMDELQTIFGRIEAERVVVFLDACYSGAAGGRTFLSKKTRAGAVDDLFLERLTRSKGRAIVTASRPSEVSLELPDLGHGIFTYYLVQGLRGAADLNRDGIVTLEELYEYLEPQVSQRSRSVGGNQHPVMKGELEGVLPLVKVRK